MSQRDRGPFDGAFERGYVPMDEPPGFEEREYRKWKKAGGTPSPGVTLETRRPALLKDSSYGALARAVPLLSGYVFFVDASKAAELVPPSMKWLRDAPHWVPTDVFGQLGGMLVPAGVYEEIMVFTGTEAATANLAAVWAEVRNRK